MKIKKITDPKLLKKFSDRKGFVVGFNPPSKKTDTDEIDKTLIENKVAECEPEFVYSINDVWFFIYPKKKRFDYELLEFWSKPHGRATNMWQTQNLHEVISKIP